MRAHVLVLLLATMLGVPARAAGPAECLVGFRFDAPPDGGVVTRRACDGVCSFTVSLCTDVTVDGVRCPFGPARLISRGPSLPRFPPFPGQRDSCTGTNRITLPASSRQVYRAKARGAGGSRDRDRLVLRCRSNPTNRDCDDADTTTTTAATTSTTHVSAPVITLPTSTTLPDDPSCVRTGCSSHLCDEQHLVSTCEWHPIYACYRLAICERQPHGGCGWTPTEAFTACAAQAGGISPSQMP